MRLNLADTLLLLSVVIGGLRGLSRGIWREVLGTVGFVGGLAVAIGLTGSATEVMSERVALPNGVLVGATFAALYASVSGVAGWAGLLVRRPATGISRIVGKVCGGVVGAGKALALVAVLMAAGDVLVASPRLGGLISGSTLVRPVVGTMQALLKAGRVSGAVGALGERPRS